MYSPSLISVLWHTLVKGVENELSQFDAKIEEPQELVSYLQALGNATETANFAPVPTVVISQQADAMIEFMGSSAETAELTGNRGSGQWGRFPVQRLLNYLQIGSSFDHDEEFMDVGTRVRYASQVGTPAHASISSLIQQTGTQSDTVWVAIVDEGDRTKTPPEDFGGKLQQAVGGAGTLGPHAEEMLAIILERLDRQHNALADVRVAMALVRPPTSSGLIGLHVFEHDNVVEILSATRTLSTALQNKDVCCFNLSLGTHVGPHNGDSPFEELIESIAQMPSRYLISSAGNDGQRGVAATRRLRAGIPEDLVLRLSGSGAHEVLVVFWWRDDPMATLSLEAMVRDSRGNRLYPVAMSISTGSPQTSLSSRFAYQFSSPDCKHGGLAMPSSLCSARCRGDMNCATYAVSAAHPDCLANIDIEFRLLCDHDRIVNCWLTVCDDARATFVAGTSSATMTVPSTAPGVVGVAGVRRDDGQLWQHSSRGPVPNYDPKHGAGATPEVVPKMAHLIDTTYSTGEGGTSNASARACADAVGYLVNNSGSFPQDAEDLCKCVLIDRGESPTSNADPRIGYGAIKT